MKTRTLALAVLAALAAPALAQNRGTQPVGAAAVELADRPLICEPLGLRMMLPIGASAETLEMGAKTHVRVRLPGGQSAINVQDARTASEQELTVVLDGIIRQRLGLDEYGAIPKPGFRTPSGSGRLLERQDDLIINGMPARRAFIQVREPVGADTVLGYTVFEPTPRRFVTVELISSVERFNTDRPMYVTSVGTIEFEDPAEVAVARTVGVELGVRVFQELTPSDYEQVISAFGSNWQWERLYSPSVTGAPGDDEEIGYRRIAASVGTRGDLDPKRRTRSGADRQAGYIVHVDSRTLHQQYVIDSAAAFFMTPDREEEAWTIRMAIRNRKTGEVQNSTEVGARDVNSMTVSTTIGNEDPVVVRPLIQGEGYISRVESYLLPHLLAQAGIPGDYRFYAFQSRSGQIQMRSDLLEHPAETKAWKLTTRLSSNDASQTSYYDDDGTFLRTELPDGRLWEPIELQRLVKLWRDKSLPMD